MYGRTHIFLLLCFFLIIACFLPCLPITRHIYNAKYKIVKIAQKVKEGDMKKTLEQRQSPQICEFHHKTRKCSAFFSSCSYLWLLLEDLT